MARPKKTTPAESPVATAVEAVKETVAAKKAAAEKKTTAKKTEVMYLQSGGAEWDITNCKERAVAAYVEGGHKASSVKKLEIYLKPEEGKAYYVVNDDVNGSIDL